MQQNRQSGFLDVLRVAAIGLVLLRHGISTLSPPQDENALPGFLGTIAANGWLGVDLFFVLSGYLLCSQILDAHETGSWHPRNFYLRRAVRILPPYLTVLIVCWLGAVSPILGSEGVGSPLVLLSHLLFLQDYFGSPLMVTLWSLATEEKFYLALPLLAALLVRMGSNKAALLLMGTSAAIAASRTLAIGAMPPGSYSEFFWNFRAPFHFAIDGLLIGTAAAFAERQLRLESPTSRLLVGIGGAAALLATLALLCAREWLGAASFSAPSIAIWGFSACCGALVLAVRRLKVEDRLPKAPKLITRLAVLSYSLYLVHYPVAVAAQHALASEGGLLFWLVYLGVSLVLAWILNSLTEAPFRQWRQRLRHQALASRGETLDQTTQAV